MPADRLILSPHRRGERPAALLVLLAALPWAAAFTVGVVGAFTEERPARIRPSGATAFRQTWQRLRDRGVQWPGVCREEDLPREGNDPRVED